MPFFGITFLDRYTHTVCLVIFFLVVVTFGCNQADRPGNADHTVPGSLPYAHDVFHGRRFNGFLLFVKVDGNHRSVNLSAIDDGARSVSTA